MITVRDLSTGQDHRGRSPESIARRVWGRDARVVYSPDPNRRWQATVVRGALCDGATVLGVLHLDEEARAAAEQADLREAARALARARSALAAAESALTESVATALAGGVRAVDVASVLGVSRARVYQIRDGRR